MPFSNEIFLNYALKNTNALRFLCFIHMSLFFGGVEFATLILDFDHIIRLIGVTCNITWVSNIGIFISTIATYVALRYHRLTIASVESFLYCTMICNVLVCNIYQRAYTYFYFYILPYTFEIAMLRCTCIKTLTYKIKNFLRLYHMIACIFDYFFFSMLKRYFSTKCRMKIPVIF